MKIESDFSIFIFALQMHIFNAVGLQIRPSADKQLYWLNS